MWGAVGGGDGGVVGGEGVWPPSSFTKHLEAHRHGRQDRFDFAEFLQLGGQHRSRRRRRRRRRPLPPPPPSPPLPVPRSLRFGLGNKMQQIQLEAQTVVRNKDQ